MTTNTMTNQQDPQTPIYMWEFEWYSEEEEDNLDCCYYTYSDEPELAQTQFTEDEGAIDYTLQHVGEMTREDVEDIYGLDIILEHNRGLI